MAENMSPLLCDYAERFVLGCLAAIAFIAGMAGLLALPVSGLLLAFRKAVALPGPAVRVPSPGAFFPGNREARVFLRGVSSSTSGGNRPSPLPQFWRSQGAPRLLSRSSS